MNPTFFDQIQPALAVERLDAYRQDQAEPRVALARYLWNMALCESLYSPLQMVEIALRNALQRSLENHFHSPHWYDVPACWHLLTSTQQSQIDVAKQNLARQNKPLAPGRIVAELTFGFWTAFFNKRSAQNRDIIRLTARVFQSAPKSQRDIRSLNRRLTLLRELRNRVFHHERIIHWTDLDTRHAAIRELCQKFNEGTRDGRDMKRYSNLLDQAIRSVIDVKEESDIESLFTPGKTTALVETISGLDDFELIAFIVIQNM